ncbi:MAG TPA: twin-arginine translocase subunit TatC [Chitinophagales bacterium]|nr:twin-arginine translocase subunit TatC [Chitinophagales bacterium]
MLKKLLNLRSQGDAEMSFMDHLEELRWHVVRVLLAIIGVGVVLFLNKGFLFDTVILGPKNPDFFTYRAMCWLTHRFNLGEDLCIKEIGFRLINRDLSAPFMIHLQTSFTVALVMVFPYLLWELWRFVEPALYETERKNIGGTVFLGSLMFYLGAAFGYYMVAPFSVQFLGSYRISADIENTVDISSYVGSVTGLVFACGIVFEFPLIVYFLSRLGVMTPAFMRTYRKYALVAILFLAAIITPSPDMFSQVIVALPLYVLYEISVTVSARVNKRRQLADEREELVE